MKSDFNSRKQTIFVKLNPFPLPSIDSPFLFKEHLETIRLDDQAIVKSITVLPANVLKIIIILIIVKLEFIYNT